MASARSSSEPLAGRDAVLAGLGEETRRRFDLYAALLVRWQATINLVAPSTLPELWTRHVGDSLQVAAALPDARRWVDLGSGGGFPGMVTAILHAADPRARVHLVESDKRKCAFLRTVARETGAPAVIHAERIETAVPALVGRLREGERIEAVSARALAPLPRLLGYAAPLIAAGAAAIFPKGEAAELETAELTGPDAARRFSIAALPSRSRDGSRLLIVRAIDPVVPDSSTPTGA